MINNHVASGLYVFSMFAEEKPVQAKTIIQILIIISTFQTVLCLRFIPWYVVIFNIIGHVCYFIMSKSIPYIDMYSPLFLATCICACVSHCVFTLHFLLSPVWEFTRLILVNLFTLWTVPLLLLASAMGQGQTLVGGEDDENKHKSVFQNWMKKFFSGKENN